jgi:UDP-N-acetyl-D-mannosaminuronate dehydrogenase
VAPDFGAYDLVVIVTDHDVLDRQRLAREAALIVDTRDTLHGIAVPPGRVFGL